MTMTQTLTTRSTDGNAEESSICATSARFDMEFVDNTRDHLWISQAQQGNMEGAGALLEHYKFWALRSAKMILRYSNEEELQDIVSQSNVKVMANITRFNLEKPFLPWYKKIIKNNCLNLMTYNKTHPTSVASSWDDPTAEYSQSIFDVIPDTSFPSSRTNAEKMETINLIARCLEQLKPKFKEIIIMRYFEDMPYEHIAKKLEVPQGTVMSRLFLAREKLAELIKSMSCAD
jgi:RNA polymerase sigma-70 factor (ECF subfamily)